MTENGRDDDTPRAFASPACLLHEVDPAYSGLPMAPNDATAVYAWRKPQRQRLIAARLALPAEERTALAAVVAGHLDGIVPVSPATIVSVYWPFRGELDLRPWMTALITKGTRVALPVVAVKAQPLIFREWQPHCRMEKGIWDIPIPADGPEVTPTVVIAPLVGFDCAGYRLGHGGGFFDRTLAALAQRSARPLAIGVGYRFSALATIYAQPHDIPMDVIITDAIADFRSQPDEVDRGHR